MAGFRVSYDTLYESASPRERGEIVYSRAHAVLEGPLRRTVPPSRLRPASSGPRHCVHAMW